MRRDAAGFTLVELAVVVVIAGILLMMTAGTWSAIVASTNVSSTKEKLETIRTALVNHVRKHGRLPCPDIGPATHVGASFQFSLADPPDGQENRSSAPGGLPNPTSSCALRNGVVPYADLSLPRDAAIDAWGGMLSYVVSNVPVKTDWTITGNLRIGNEGLLRVSDRLSPPVTAVAVIVSHGPNGLGAWTSKGTRLDFTGAGNDEISNFSGCTGTENNTCYRRDVTDSTAVSGGAIDDLVLGVTADDFYSALATSDDAKDPYVDYAEQCAKAKEKLLLNGFLNKTGDRYEIDTLITLKDPWRNINLNCSVETDIRMTSTGNLCSVIASGPDLTLGTADDAQCLITKDALRAVFMKTGF